jgi:hypothetical protein
MNTHVTKTIAAMALSCLVSPASAQFVNPSFEQGLSGWTYNTGVFVIGSAGSQPIGVSGSLSADLGGGDISGAQMSQTINVLPDADYQLSFFSAANGAGAPGLTSIGKVEIIATNGTLLASQSFTNLSPSPMLGTNGFSPVVVPLSTGANQSSITVRFSDQTPNGGIGVDVAVDAVNLTLIAARHRLMVDLYAGILLSGPEPGTYAIQYADSLNGQTSTNWQSLTNLTLTTFPHLFLDTSNPSSGRVQRFYRSVFTP